MKKKDHIIYGNLRLKKKKKLVKRILKKGILFDITMIKQIGKLRME